MNDTITPWPYLDWGTTIILRFFDPPHHEDHSMSETAQADNNSNLFKLATRPRHQWGPQHHVPWNKSWSGHEQFEWHCAQCQLVRITVCPRSGRGEPYRAYRKADSPVQFEAERDPDCVPMAVEMGCGK